IYFFGRNQAPPARMTISEVVFLEEAISDLEEGRQFYEDIEEGIGLYFTDSLLADAASLKLYAGIHLIHYSYFRILEVTPSFTLAPCSVLGELDDNNKKHALHRSTFGITISLSICQL
ncbi:MAG: hypothetical protein GXP30_11360, partial [Verrucomicrobia bacterium]|nr:hypothetical protein [Verrucomicrobiota bacterium]